MTITNQFSLRTFELLAEENFRIHPFSCIQVCDSIENNQDDFYSIPSYIFNCDSERGDDADGDENSEEIYEGGEDEKEKDCLNIDCI